MDEPRSSVQPAPASSPPPSPPPSQGRVGAEVIRWLRLLGGRERH